MEIGKDLSEKAKNDLVLVEQARNGNEKAFASLLNRYRDSIYFMLLLKHILLILPLVPGCLKLPLIIASISSGRNRHRLPL